MSPQRESAEDYDATGLAGSSSKAEALGSHQDQQKKGQPEAGAQRILGTMHTRHTKALTLHTLRSMPHLSRDT